MSGNGSVYNSVYRTYITRGDAFGYREGNESSYQRDREFDLLNEDSHNSYEWFEVEPEPLTDEEIEKHFEEERKKKQNVRRDRKGRLEKGSMIAKKRSCDEEEILALYKGGFTVKKIVEFRGCSKSTVYNVIKEYKKKEKK